MDDLVERLRAWSEHAEVYGSKQSRNAGKLPRLLAEAAARIQALETSLAEAGGRVIAEVVAWLQRMAEEVESSRSHWHNREIIASTVANIATALETGEWKK